MVDEFGQRALLVAAGWVVGVAIVLVPVLIWKFAERKG
jgi:hypothetical protein